MTRLILTADASAAGGLQTARRADIAIPVEPRLVWGPLPPDAALMASFAPEVGALLDGLAHCPALAVSGLDEGPFTEEMHRDKARLARYRDSKISLTALGKAVLAQTEDFSRHNPIHRWWGGTQLTSQNLWRWDSTNGALIAP